MLLLMPACSIWFPSPDFEEEKPDGGKEKIVETEPVGLNFSVFDATGQIEGQYQVESGKLELREISLLDNEGLVLADWQNIAYDALNRSLTPPVSYQLPVESKTLKIVLGGQSGEDVSPNLEFVGQFTDNSNQVSRVEWETRVSRTLYFKVEPGLLSSNILMGLDLNVAQLFDFSSLNYGFLQLSKQPAELIRTSFEQRLSSELILEAKNQDSPEENPPIRLESDPILNASVESSESQAGSVEAVETDLDIPEASEDQSNEDETEAASHNSSPNSASPGEFLWIDDSGNEAFFGRGRSVFEDSEGNLFVTGGTYPPENVNPDKDTQVFVAKFSASGELVWRRDWNRAARLRYGISIAGSGNLLCVVGRTDYEGGYFDQRIADMPGEKRQGFITVMDKQGNPLWHRLLGGYAEHHSCGWDEAGNLYVAGLSQEKLQVSDSRDLINSPDSTFGYVVSYTSTGDYRWFHSFSEGQYKFGAPHDLAIRDNQVYVAADRGSSTDSENYESFVFSLSTETGAKTAEYGFNGETGLELRRLLIEGGHLYVASLSRASPIIPSEINDYDIEVFRLPLDLTGMDWRNKIARTGNETLRGFSSLNGTSFAVCGIINGTPEYFGTGIDSADPYCLQISATDGSLQKGKAWRLEHEQRVSESVYSGSSVIFFGHSKTNNLDVHWLQKLSFGD